MPFLKVEVFKEFVSSEGLTGGWNLVVLIVQNIRGFVLGWLSSVWLIRAHVGQFLSSSTILLCNMLGGVASVLHSSRDQSFRVVCGEVILIARFNFWAQEMVSPGSTPSSDW